MRNKFIQILTLAVLVCGCSGNGPAYRNPSLSPERRAADLLKRMTIEEKIGQIICPYGWPMFEKLFDSTATYSGEFVNYIKNQHGGMLWGLFRADPWTGKTLENGLDPRSAVSAYNALQHYAVDSTRLGIPIILAEEAPHGHMAIGTTVFPTGIALASTWDSDLMEEVGRSIAEELRAVGACIAYGPVIDLARDPRWSRVEETFGEDVCLTSQMAGGVVRGMAPKRSHIQAKKNSLYDIGVAATLKHFVAYGVPQGGHNGNVSAITNRDLYENVLPTFKAGIDAGALSVMTSYNSLDGIPSTANKALLTDLLRGEWGFEGIVVSDLISIDGLCGTHRVVGNLADAAQAALEAGVDVDLGANCYILLKDKIENKEISIKTLDNAVRRVLETKFRFGLFDHPYIDEDKWTEVRCEKHTQTALQAAREGVVLLENNGILPLAKETRVAVIGPNADRMYNQLGDYTAPQSDENITTPLEGIRALVGADRVIYARGCAVRDTRGAGIAEAVRAAKSADVAVVFVGGSSARDFDTVFSDTGAADAGGTSPEDGNSDTMEYVSDMECGEGFDRSTLTLMGRQQELLEALKATGKPLVVVYIEGRPLDKRWAKDNADALLTQFYPGQAGGKAIAEVLFGEYSPSGRLPISVPATVGQIPVHYNQPFPFTGDYIDCAAAPLYPFGYGLTYSKFTYDAMKCEDLGGGRVRVTVTVTNAGNRDSDEVVQVYVTDKVASTVRPRLQLRGFERTFFKAGQTREITFELGRDAFALYNKEMEFVIEKGTFIIHCGPSSAELPLAEEIVL